MTHDIQRLLCESEVLKHNLPCENVSFPIQYECDVLSIKKSGYITEFEVKISRSDFLADKKKNKWYLYADPVYNRYKPNYFNYVCPDGLIQADEIPPFAGLIYLVDGDLKEVKKASVIHRFKHDRDKVLSKFLRVMTERAYLGCCRMTYENAKIRERNQIITHKSL